MRRVTLLLALCAACTGPERAPVAPRAPEVGGVGGAERDGVEASDPLRGYAVSVSRAGMFTAAWRVVGRERVPENEAFELDVRLFEGAGQDGLVGPPLTGAEVLVSAWMPDHGHGMNRKPEAIEVEPGRYRVRGMLLHMGGFWQLFIDVIQGGVSERAQFELSLE